MMTHFEIANLSVESSEMMESMKLGLLSVLGLFFLSACQPNDAASLLASLNTGTIPLPTASPSPGGAVPNGKWLNAYYTGYDQVSLPLAQVYFASFTHLVLAAIIPHADGSLDTTFYFASTNADGAQWSRTAVARAHQAGKKAIVMLGGGGSCSWPNLNTSAYSTLVSNLIALQTTNGFDGIDLDEECGHSALVPALAQSLRTALPSSIITVAAAYANLNLNPRVDPNIVLAAPYVDQINLMTYEMAGDWSGWASWHSSALQGAVGNHPTSVSSSVDAYLTAGIQAEKLGIGMGFYGLCYGDGIIAPLTTLTTMNRSKQAMVP